MKKNIHLTLRQLLFACFFLLTFTGITILLFCYKRDEKRFSHITSQLFIEEMCASTLNMHYTLAYPEKFGIPGYRAVLPLYSREGQLAGQAATENTLASLYSIHAQKLSHSDQYTYKLLTRSLENTLKKNAFPYFDEPLSPASGMQSQLPILLAEYTFRSKRDVKDYLSLLEQTDDYFSSLLTYEQEKAAAGLLMPASSLEKVRRQCDTIVTREALEAETHFLQTTFSQRLLALYESGGLTRDEVLSYLSQNNRLLKTVLLPAYEALSDGLCILEDATIPLCGLARKPGGAEYYEYLLVAETGSYRPIEEICSLLSQRLAEEYEAIHTLAAQNPDCLSQLMGEAYASLPYRDAKTMLADIQVRMEQDFPRLTSQNFSSPNTTIKRVASNLEDFCAPAFYLTTPIDDTDNNVIYINQKNAPNGLELYTTLAHEGYPGHLYQNVYSSRCLLKNGDNKIRSLLWYGGYLEGWALYVEFLSFDYAADLMLENNRPQDAVCVQLEKQNRSLLLCVYSLIDIMIHHENANVAEIAKILEPFHVTDTASVDAIYTYIAENPCNYLKYYLGYLEILELKKQAAAIWGSAYSDYNFHSFYLNCGPSDFTSLSEQLQSFRSSQAG